MGSIKNNQMECRDCHKIVPTFNKYNQKLKFNIPYVNIFGTEVPGYMEFTGVNRLYELGLCEDCCRKHFEKKWKGNVGKEPSRRFYLVNSMSKAAYGVSDEEYKILKQKSKETHAVTLENLVRKYGEEEGNKKWDNYCKKQAETNTFEYKKEKYGWTKEQFDKYNASRAVTQENLIKRWGEEEGKKRLEKHYKNLVHRTEDFKSVASKFCFIKIIDYLNKNYSKEFNYTFNDNNVLYYNKEVSKICGNKAYYLDCYFKDFNIDIEYNGDIFHGNPKLYKDDTKCNFFSPDLTAKDLQEKDDIRYKQLKEYHDIDTLVIWEYDYNINKEWTVEGFVDNTLVPLLRKKKDLK